MLFKSISEVVSNKLVLRFIGTFDHFNTERALYAFTTKSNNCPRMPQKGVYNSLPAKLDSFNTHDPSLNCLHSSLAELPFLHHRPSYNRDKRSSARDYETQANVRKQIFNCPRGHRRSRLVHTECIGDDTKESGNANVLSGVARSLPHTTPAPPMPHPEQSTLYSPMPVQ
ncbi:hypothetical protein FRC03_005375 [Tulasnella sp. 419]|nr:hypothetical protein FRC03_005375 [Tulasnella sp. 419]